MPSALRASAAASGVSRLNPSAVATKVPIKLARSVGQSRRMSGASDGPNQACQMLVMSAGMTISAAASPGDMIRLRTPTATVGRPWPSTPLTKPASTKAKPARARIKLESGMSGLQRLAAHQPGLRGGRRDALAQHGAAQGADPVEQVEAEAARALHRQEAGQERAVEQVDGEGATLHVSAAKRVVAGEQIGP